MTEDEYIEELNQLEPDWDSEEWIIGGANRRRHYYPEDYGQACHDHDSVGFNVGYQERCRDEEYHQATRGCV